MFILKTNEVGTAMFAKGQMVELDIDLWHKRINHFNFPKFHDMQGARESRKHANLGSKIGFISLMIIIVAVTRST